VFFRAHLENSKTRVPRRDVLLPHSAVTHRGGLFLQIGFICDQQERGSPRRAVGADLRFDAFPSILTNVLLKGLAASQIEDNHCRHLRRGRNAALSHGVEALFVRRLSQILERKETVLSRTVSRFLTAKIGALSGVGFFFFFTEEAFA
jgi:hypothetical protein